MEAGAGQDRHGGKRQQKPLRVSLEDQAYLNTVLAREERYMGSTQQPRVYEQDLGDAAFVTSGPWMDRTRWPTIYEDVRRDILLGLTPEPAA